MQAAFVLLVLATTAANSYAQDSLQIPVRDSGAPARDLLRNGALLDRDEAISLSAQGEDLSLLEPAPNDSYAGTDQALAAGTLEKTFPNDDATLDFASDLLSSVRIIRSRVLYRNAENPRAQPISYRVSISLSNHAFLMRSALLRKLGYRVPPIRYYPKLKLRFADSKAAERFLKNIESAFTYEISRWLVEKSADGTVVTLRDVNLETARIENQEYQMGTIPASEIDGLRTIRSLIVPIALTEIPQTPNFYPLEFGKVFNQAVTLTALYANQFQGETTWDDARWIARKIARLTRDDWKSIVAQGRYPEDISALILEKALVQRNQMVALFELDRDAQNPARALPTNARISIGAVKNGVATQPQYEGYALRFTAGEEPESPLTLPEILRYALMEGISYGLAQGTQFLNEKLLTLQSANDIAQKRRDEMFEAFKQHIADHPNEPYVQPVEVWGGPIAGLQVQVSRNLTTGDYFGGEAKIQLVDVISITANAGYFASVSGLRNITPSGIVQGAVTRTYVHVRPIASVKAALESNWVDLFVPSVFWKIANKLVPATKDGKLSDGREELKAFTEALLPGELFTISDSISASARLSANIPLAAFLGPNPAFGLGTLIVGSGFQGVLLSRTTISRTKEKPDASEDFNRPKGELQIYLQNARSRTIDASIDGNFFLKVFRAAHYDKSGSGRTKAYLLDLARLQSDAPGVAYADTLAALRSIFKSNESEIIEKTFSPFEITHSVDLQSGQLKFLRWQWYQFEESHRLTIRPPKDPKHDFDPAKFERTLYSHRLSQIRGTNDYQFMSDILEGIFPGNGSLTAKSGNNPSNSFLGQSFVRTVGTEAEITEKTDPMKSALIRVERTISGPEISASSLARAIDKIEARVKKDKLSLPLFNRDALAQTKSIQFYSIQSNLFLYKDAVQAIDSLLFANKSPAKAYADVESIAGRSKIRSWCRLMQINLSGGPISRSSVIPSYSEFDPTTGKYFRVGCTIPWVEKLMSLRKLDRSTPEARLKVITWAAHYLENELSFNAFSNLVGADHLFFQVKISGFRSDDPVGDSDLVSNSIGSYDREQGAGVFTDFATRWNIMSSELRATYLGEGF